MIYAIILLSILSLVVFIRTWMFKADKIEVIPYEKRQIDVARVAAILSKAIKYRTISEMNEDDINYSTFQKYNEFIEATYPNVFKTAIKTVVNKHSIILKIPGKNMIMDPILLTAHYDVVPASEETLHEWKYGPFSGEVADGYVWGRGALDDKVNQILILEAMEILISEDKLPDYDIYIAFGHDEEIGGKQGAKLMAEYFLKENIRFRFVLDEGGAVTEGALTQIKEPVAVIGTCEKGFSNIRLSTVSAGGHTSIPPKYTGLYHISKAVTRLEEKQMPLGITEPVMDMLNSIGPKMNIMNRIIISNMWIFKSLFIKEFSKSNTGNALLRTTGVATMAKGSELANVLAKNAHATFSYRIAPGDSSESVLKHLSKVINNDAITVEPLLMNNPSNISPTNCEQFNVIKKTVKQLFPDALVTPYLMLGGSDARYYESVSKHVYRFCPYRITNDDLSSIHSCNERISLDNLEVGVQFYIQLIENTKEI